MIGSLFVVSRHRRISVALTYRSFYGSFKCFPPTIRVDSSTFAFSFPADFWTVSDGGFGEKQGFWILNLLWVDVRSSLFFWAEFPPGLDFGVVVKWGWRLRLIPVNISGFVIWDWTDCGRGTLEDPSECEG